MTRKILFVATVVKTHIMQFHIPYLKMMKEEGWETAVAARNDYEDPNDCNIPYCDQYFDIPFERNPFKSGNITSYKMLKQIIDEGQYDIVHCHTPVGAMIARLASRNARKKGTAIIYTAHGFHFFDGAPLKNWLLYYPAEKYLAHYTDVLITINQEDYKRAQQFSTNKVVYMPGVGIDVKSLSVSNAEKNEKRKTLQLKPTDYILLSVGELIPRKNHIRVLEVLHELKQHPVYQDLQVLICGSGTQKDELSETAKQFGIDDHVHFLGYRHDLPELFHCSDLFIHMAKHEGLPVAVMSAMAAGLPVVCTAVRGNTDLIQDKKNGYLVSDSTEELKNTILYCMDHKEETIQCGQKAKETVKAFELSRVLPMMHEIYMESLKK